MIKFDLTSGNLTFGDHRPCQALQFSWDIPDEFQHILSNAFCEFSIVRYDVISCIMFLLFSKILFNLVYSQLKYFFTEKSGMSFMTHSYNMFVVYPGEKACQKWHTLCKENTHFQNTILSVVIGYCLSICMGVSWTFTTK